MKKSTIQKVISLMIFTLLLTTVLAPATVSAASSSISYKKNYTMRSTFDEGVTTSILYINNLPEGASIVNVKSSKKSVVKASTYRSAYIDGIYLVAARPGKATVSFKIRENEKTSKTYKSKITVKKASTPFKSLKWGKKQLASKYNGTYRYGMYTTTKKQKFKVTLKSGYKIQSISRSYYDSASESHKYQTYDKYKGKKTATISFAPTKNFSYIYISYTYKLNGETLSGGSYLYLYP